MSDPTLSEVMARLDDLLKEVRRQGRASVAAQAAAESCLEAIERDRREDAGSDEDDAPPEGASLDVAARWLRALIPVVDAVDRISTQASALAQARPEPKRSLLDRIVHPLAHDGGDGRALAALDGGIRVLKIQLETALRDLGVSVDRRVGAPVSGEQQRVVEVRPPKAGERPGQVVEVVRAGFALGGAVVREAEVVATAGGAVASPGGNKP